MANTVIGFTIDINGIDNIDKLNKEIKDTNEALKGLTVGTKEYAETSEKLAKLRAEQKALRKNQTELTKSFLEQSNALNAYDKASAKLNRLRKEFKNLAIQGKESTKRGKKLREEIQKLDKQLKSTDEKVGQFQRNVGNYPRVFGLSTKAIIKQIPVLDKLNKRLEKTTGVSNLVGKAFIAGFAAFRAAEVLGRVFEQFDELIKKIDETRNAVARFSGVGGEQLDSLSASVTALSTTFDVDSEQLAKSAKALSQQLGISFEDALNKIENGLKAGQASNEEYLSSIEQTPEAFKDAGEAAGDYAERTGKLLDANKELAAAQIELANEFAGSAGGLKTFAAQAQAFLIRTLLSIIEIFRPVVSALQELGKSLKDLFSGFKIFKGEADATKGILEFLLIPLKTFAGIITTVANGIKLAADFFKNLVAQSPALQKFIALNVQGFKRLTGFFADLPFIFAGVVESLKQLGTNFKNFFESLFIDAQILAARVKGIFSKAAKDQIQELKKRRAEINADGQSLGAAFTEGFNNAKAKADEERKKREAAQAKANAEAQKKQIEEQAAEERKKRLAEAKKTADALAKQRAKEREKFLKDEAAFIEKQTQILQKLQEKQNKLITEAIADEQTKQRVKAKQASEQRITAAEKEFNALKDAAEKRTAEAARLFGENSEQAKQAAIQGAQDIAAAESTLNDIRRRERIELTNELLEIDKQFREKQQAADEKRFNEQLAQTKAAADLAQSKLDERLAKGLISEQEAAQESFNITKERIQKELELIEQRQQALAAQGIELTESENAAILAQKQALYTELAQLEKGYTEQVEQEAEAREKATAEEAAKRLQDFQKTFADIAGNLQQGFQLLTDLANASDERRKARLEKQAEDNAKINENLNERLQNASGLERRFLEQQIQANENAAEQIAKKKEEIEKQQAKRAKARAIIESIIATALAVTKALPNAVAATIAGIVGAAQTAIIAAQPLAKGGKVGALSGEIVQFNTGGKVTNKGNIKPLSNGDNVLATLKTGEVVLTQEQQARIGGASVLRAAGVPNFAQGGLVGAPSNIIQQTTEAKANSLQMLESIQKAIEATNSRVDRLQVVWTSESQAEQDKGLNDREQIRTNATF